MNKKIKTNDKIEFIKTTAVIWDSIEDKSKFKNAIVFILGDVNHSNQIYTDGKYYNAEGYTYNSVANNFAEGKLAQATGENSHAEGWDTTSVGIAAHAEGRGNQAKGDYSHAEGQGNTSSGESAHSEGKGNQTKGANSHSEGQGNINAGDTAHAEGQGNNISESGVYAHAEGQGNTVSGTGAHAEGQGNTVSGAGAHAEGTYNVDGTNWIHMVGVGDSSEHKNAHTITKDGKHYIIGVGGYTGVETNLDNIQDVATVLSNTDQHDIIPISYIDLKYLRDAHQLIPNQTYRITDYFTEYPDNNNLTSNMEQFDIIITAQNNHIFYPECGAAPSSGLNYFDGCDLYKWKLWYDIDNNSQKYSWSQGWEGFFINEENTMYTFTRCPYSDGYYNNELYLGYQELNGSRFIYTKQTDYVTDFNDDNLYTGEDDSGQIFMNINNTYGNFSLQTFTQLQNAGIISASYVGQYGGDCGEGIIYRMIDEFGNDCSYDFKNIKFLLTRSFIGQHRDWWNAITRDGAFPSSDEWFFTFSHATWTGSQFVCQSDASLNLDSKILCHNNIIKPTTNKNNTYFDLQMNIFCSYDNDQIRDNYLAEGCNNNIFGTEAIGNILNHGCYNNAFGHRFQGNLLELYCNNNQIGNQAKGNIFREYCNKNKVITMSLMEGNIFGAKCQNNNIYNNLYVNNTFGDGSQNNTIETNCEGNNFGKYFKGNELYVNDGSKDSFKYNTFGECCESNTIYGTFEHNIFGNKCSKNYLDSDPNGEISNSFMKDNRFGDWCRQFIIEGPCEKNVFGQDCYNILLYNSSTKDSFKENTFGDHCNNIKFGPGCRYNKFGHKCNNLEFGTKYQYMFFKNNCSRVYFKKPDAETTPRTYSIINNCSNITILNDTRSITVIDDYKKQLPIIKNGYSINESSTYSYINISSNSSCVLIGTEPENERYNVDKYCPLYANGLAAFLIKSEMKYLEVNLNAINLPNQYYIIHLFNTNTSGRAYNIDNHKTYNPITSQFEVANSNNDFNKITGDVNIHITDLLKAAKNHNASFMMIEVGTDNNTTPELNSENFNWKFGYDDDRMQNLVINPDAKLDKYELDYFLQKMGQKETIYIGGCPVQILPNMEIQFHSMPYDEDPRPTESTGTEYDDTRMIFKINASNDWIEQYKDNIEVQLFRINKNKWTNCKSHPNDIAEIEDDRRLYPIENQILSNLSNYKAARGVYYERNRFVYPYMVYHILRRYIRFTNGGGNYNKLDLTNVLKQGSPNTDDSSSIEWDGRHTIQILGTDNSLIGRTNGFAAEFQLRLKLFDRYSEPLRFKLHFGLHGNDGQKLYCSGTISGMNYKTN